MPDGEEEISWRGEKKPQSSPDSNPVDFDGIKRRSEHFGDVTEILEKAIGRIVEVIHVLRPVCIPLLIFWIKPELKEFMAATREGVRRLLFFAKQGHFRFLA